MKTTTTIKAFAYPVTMKDHRTGETSQDVIVLHRDWLRFCGNEGLGICDDKQMIFRAYNRRGFEVIEVGRRCKVNLTVDLERLYIEQAAVDPALNAADLTAGEPEGRRRAE